MKEITMREYDESKTAFFRKHYGENGYRESSKLEGDIIRKIYCFEDGATWYEVTMPEYVTIENEIHGIRVKSTHRLYSTEVWDTENSISRKLWEAA